MSFGENLSNIPPDALAERFEAQKNSGPTELRAPYGAYDGPHDGGFRRFIGEHSEAMARLLDTVEADAQKHMTLEQASLTVSYVETAFLALCTYADSLNTAPADPPQAQS